MRTALVTGLAAGLFLAAASALAQLPAPARPDVLMSALTTEVLTVIRRDAAADRPTDFTQLMETKILPVFDFEHMTRIAVARNWRLASAAQQAALVAQFRTLLVRTYSSALSSYRDERIEYKPLRPAAAETDVRVRSVVRRRGAEPMSIDYDMESTPAGWKVYDVKIAGVSLVMTYRDSFGAEVRAGGIDGLIKALSDRNRQNAQAMGEATERLAPLLMLYSGGARAL
jgi:phospholipid transport system substrate-binding protein